MAPSAPATGVQMNGRRRSAAVMFRGAFLQCQLSCSCWYQMIRDDGRPEMRHRAGSGIQPHIKAQGQVAHLFTLWHRAAANAVLYMPGYQNTVQADGGYYWLEYC